MMSDEMKTKFLMMNHNERLAFLNHVLDTDGLRFKLIEIIDLKKEIKKLEAEIEPYKLTLVETMKALKLGEHEISDGVTINIRKGSRYYRISYSDIEKKHPELLDQLQDIIKITETKDTYTTKFRDE